MSKYDDSYATVGEGWDLSGRGPNPHLAEPEIKEGFCALCGEDGGVLVSGVHRECV